MPVVTTDYVGEWKETPADNTPGGNASRREGDDEMRMTRSTVKKSFPNIFDAVTPTADELNQLDGIAVDRTVEQRLNDYEQSFPPGSACRMLFYNTIPPVGWVGLSNEANGRMLRVVNTNTTGGTGGGTHDPTVMDHVPRHNHGNSTTTSKGIHDHKYKWTNDITGSGPPEQRIVALRTGVGYGDYNLNGNIIDDGSHTHTVSIGENINSPSAAKDQEWRPLYRDVCVGQKVQV